MAKKFLYGKKRFLTPVIKGEISPRFSHISNYARLENQKMRDNEVQKNFILNRFTTRIIINNRAITPSSLVENPTISIPTQPCYCLCLSDKEDDPELYKIFQADICIEIDVDILIEILNLVFSKFKGLEIVAQQVKYFDPYDRPITRKSKELVFYKPKMFSHEAEFRVALFYPVDKRGFRGKDGSIIPFALPDENMCLEFKTDDLSLIKKCIFKVYEAPVFQLG